MSAPNDKAEPRRADDEQPGTETPSGVGSSALLGIHRESFNEVAVMFREQPDGSFGIIVDDHDLFNPGWEMDATIHVVVKNRVLLRLVKWFFGNRYESRRVAWSGKRVSCEFFHAYVRIPNDPRSATARRRVTRGT